MASFMSASRPFPNAAPRRSVRPAEPGSSDGDMGSAAANAGLGAAIASGTRCQFFFLPKPERVDHLALGIGDLDDELLVVLGVLVVRHHVVLRQRRDAPPDPRSPS